MLFKGYCTDWKRTRPATVCYNQCSQVMDRILYSLSPLSIVTSNRSSALLCVLIWIKWQSIRLSMTNQMSSCQLDSTLERWQISLKATFPANIFGKKKCRSVVHREDFRIETSEIVLYVTDLFLRKAIWVHIWFVHRTSGVVNRAKGRTHSPRGPCGHATWRFLSKQGRRSANHSTFPSWSSSLFLADRRKLRWIPMWAAISKSVWREHRQATKN